MEQLQIRKEKASREKYKLGRHVVQTKDYYGLRRGRVGWVTQTWPVTRVLFEDGTEPDMHKELCLTLEATDEYCDDVELLRTRIKASLDKHYKNITRKMSYQ